MKIRKNLPVTYSPDLYDHYTSDFVTRYDEALAGRVRAHYSKSGGGSQLLIDIGTGTARFLIRLAAIPELEQLRMVGTDHFLDMVNWAIKSVAKAGLTGRIRILKDDVHKLQFKDDCCDLLTSRSTIHHWKNPARAFKEIYRVLKPGGVAIIQDIRRDASPEAQIEFQRTREEAGVPPAKFAEKYSPLEVEVFIAKAGLSAVTRINTHPGWPIGFEVVITKPADSNSRTGSGSNQSGKSPKNEEIPVRSNPKSERRLRSFAFPWSWWPSF